MHQTDEELAVIVLKDNSCFNVLIDRYTQKIRRYIAHIIGNWQESEDLVQDVFFLAYKNIAGFNPKLKFSAWLYRIAHNHSVNYIKKHYRAKIVEFDEAIQNDLAAHVNFEDEIDHKIDRLILKKALGKLKPSEQELIYLFYEEEKKYEEIADILHLSINSVGPTLNRIKKKLKGIIDGEIRR